MRTSRRTVRNRATIGATIALGLAVLSGCAGLDDGQSVEEAYVVLSDGMADIQTELSEAQSSLSEYGDLAGATEVMAKMEGELDDLAPKITNAEVTAALTPDQINEKFDLGYHTKHVDTIFARVFGADPL